MISGIKILILYPFLLLSFFIIFILSERVHLNDLYPYEKRKNYYYENQESKMKEIMKGSCILEYEKLADYDIKYVATVISLYL